MLKIKGAARRNPRMRIRRRHKRSPAHYQLNDLMDAFGVDDFNQIRARMRTLAADDTFWDALTAARDIKASQEKAFRKATTAYTRAIRRSEGGK